MDITGRFGEWDSGLEGHAGSSNPTKLCKRTAAPHLSLCHHVAIAQDLRKRCCTLRRRQCLVSPATPL